MVVVVEGDNPLSTSLIVHVSNIDVVNGKLQICTGAVCDVRHVMRARVFMFDCGGCKITITRAPYERIPTLPRHNPPSSTTHLPQARFA